MGEGRWTGLRGMRLLRDAIRNGRPATNDPSDPRPTHTEAAVKLGIAAPTLYTWIAGTRRPGPTMREILERVLGIPRDAWLTQDERLRIERAA